MSQAIEARLYRARGRVQGVGFRNFVQREAVRLGLAGWVRNLDSGDVEVHAQGPVAALDDLAGTLHTGPRFADVRGVEQREAAVLNYRGFRIVS
ncbi:MAG: acylphosphatase [Acidobacteria bacterium]|nr:acylphosphatase [Acidobacteriota bacterium]